MCIADRCTAALHCDLCIGDLSALRQQIGRGLRQNGELKIILIAGETACGLLERNRQRAACQRCHIGIRDLAALDGDAVFQELPYHLIFVQVAEIVFVVDRDLLLCERCGIGAEPEVLILELDLGKLRLRGAVRADDAVFADAAVVRTVAPVAAVCEIFAGAVICVKILVCVGLGIVIPAAVWERGCAGLIDPVPDEAAEHVVGAADAVPVFLERADGIAHCVIVFAHDIGHFAVACVIADIAGARIHVAVHVNAELVALPLAVNRAGAVILLEIPDHVAEHAACCIRVAGVSHLIAD